MSLLFGDKFENQTKEFNEKVKAIENRHFSVFEKQVNVITGESPDRLQNHFLTTYDGYKHTIGFSKDSYVPDNIQQEVYSAFREAFSAK